MVFNLDWTQRAISKMSFASASKTSRRAKMPFFMQIKLIFINKNLREDSFWNRGERQIGNGVFALAFVLYYQVKWLAYENSRHFVLQSEVKRNMENLGLSLAPEGSFISIQTRWDNI